MIEIKCTGSDYLPLDVIEEFQGNLKKRSKKDIQQVKTSIELYGFSFPFFIWNGTGHNYCLDGHGRINAIEKMRESGEALPLFPVVYIEAKDDAEAKQKLLRLNSQYGQMTTDSVLEFMGDIELKYDEIQLPSGAISFETEEINEIEPPELYAGEKGEMEQITFTLHREQAEIVRSAIKYGKENGFGESAINENKNGNTIAKICEDFIERFS